MVVLSPPGRTRPSRSSSSSGLRNGTASAPSRRSARRCSLKAPCKARTPIFGVLTLLDPRQESPTARGEQLLLGNRPDLESLHGCTQSLAGLEDLLGLVEVCGGGDDGLGHLERVF